MPLRTPARTWLVTTLVAGAMIYGLSVLACGSFWEAIYLASVPIFVVWTLAATPRGWRTLLSRRHAAYFGLMALLVGGFMSAFAHVTPSVRVRWEEVVVAVYFLAALHVMLWSLDRLVQACFGKIISGGPGSSHLWLRAAARTGVRLLVLTVVGVPLVASALMTHWVRFDDATDPGQLAGLAYEQAGFRASDGTVLRGWYVPSRDGLSDASVILVPGRGMGKAALVPQAKALSEDGFNVLLLDLRGEGASEGHRRGFGVSESPDVVAAVDYLRCRRPAGSRHVFAVGLSQGATAILAAAGVDSRIEAVVADSPFPSPQEELASTFSWLPGPVGRYFQGATMAFASAQLGRDLSEEGACRDIARISPRAVLLIHGQDDCIVSLPMAQKVYASAGQPALLWKVPGAGHAESFLLQPKMYSDIVGKTLKSVRLGLGAFEWARKREG